MRPADDPTWPVCSVCPEDRTRHWCSVTRDYLLARKDADTIEWGMRYCIPIVPDADWFAEVSIGTEKLAGISGGLYLIKQPDPFSQTEEELYLGLWTKGEGRAAIALSIADWIESFDLTNCRFSGHGFTEESAWQHLMKSADTSGKKVNRWCLAYYGMCSFCWAGTGQVNQQAVNFTAAEFGVSQSTVGTANSSTGRQQSIMQNLQNRFGQREALDFPSDHGQWYDDNFSPRQRANGRG